MSWERMILQQDKPDDYVWRLENHSVREFVELALLNRTANIQQGFGETETGLTSPPGIFWLIDPRISVRQR